MKTYKVIIHSTEVIGAVVHKRKFHTSFKAKSQHAAEIAAHIYFNKHMYHDDFDYIHTLSYVEFVD